MAISASAHSGDEDADPVGKVACSIAAADAVLTLSRHELPLVDTAVLQDLEEQLGQPDIAWNFANDHVAMWGQRQRRLVASVGCEDRVAALDAVIGLKVSSAMVSGLRLAHRVVRLEAAVREGDRQDGADLLAVIPIHRRATVKELQLRYIRPYGWPPGRRSHQPLMAARAAAATSPRPTRYPTPRTVCNRRGDS